MVDDIHLNAVAFKEGDTWIIQGIEYDITAHSADVANAPFAFMRAVVENACITQHLGRKPLEGIKPAPDRYREMFERAGTELRAVNNPDLPLHMPIPSIRIAEEFVS